ncbi:MAG: GIY-YIG nuclease family protein [Candidatus Bathyarchaeota archaeon]|nr:GIY-YIG nuclease family protein [Candidatus Bathyarchaeum tardum]
MGVYILVVNEIPKYIGKTKNLSIRFNLGYGNISPKNCYAGGQQTNCRLNKLILDSTKQGHKIELFFKETSKITEVEEGLIDQLNPEWNLTKTKDSTQQRDIRDDEVLRKIYGKYQELGSYLKESQKNYECLKYSEIEKIIGFQLPPSAYDYGKWWLNGDTVQAKAWIDAGWMVLDLILGKFVSFVKISRKPNYFILNGKEHQHFCATPFMQVRNKNKEKNLKNICSKCKRAHSVEEIKKSKFCVECGTFIITNKMSKVRDNSMKKSFNEIWLRILKNEGGEFYTKTGKLFIYRIKDNYLIPNRTEYPLSKSEFKKGFDLMPTLGPGELSNIVRGSSYIWAILSDSRINSKKD